MSIKAMTWAWDARLPGYPLQKCVLVALCDHADNEGRNIFPAVSTVAWKTEISHRGVQRAIAWLIKHGFLIRDGEHRIGGQGGAAVKRYRAPILIAPPLCPPRNKRPAPRRRGRPAGAEGDTVTPSPTQPDDGEYDTVTYSNTTGSRDQYDCQSPNPSVNGTLTPNRAAPRAGAPDTPPPPPPTLDPLEHAFNRAVGAADESPEQRIIRGWRKLSEQEREMCAAFQEITGCVVISSVRERGTWGVGARELIAAGATRELMRAAFDALPDEIRPAITHPNALVKAVKAEQNRRRAVRAGASTDARDEDETEFLAPIKPGSAALPFKEARNE